MAPPPPPPQGSGPISSNSSNSSSNSNSAAAGRRRLAVVAKQLLLAPTAAAAATPPTTTPAYGAAAGPSSAQDRDEDDDPPAKGVARSLPRFSAYVMECYLDDLRDMKKQVYGSLEGRGDLLPAVEEGMTKEAHRELVRKLLRAMVDAGFSPLSYFDRDYRKYFYLAELMSMVDLSFTVKSGVQFSLWGGSVLNLGTERHRRQYFDDIASLRLPGCFAMTELKHGSNVAALQTEAVLDVAADEWVVHTPDEGAIKWWIGNAAEDGIAATVFARLKVPAAAASSSSSPTAATTTSYVDHGVHAFVVPLRDPATKALLPGVEIHDCGYKVGLNGVDNGAIRFTRVRVPRTNLLDRFASVDRSGRYSSPLPSEGKRFGATLGELTGGRVGLCSASVGVLKGAATIAVRYCAGRQQFGPPGGASEVAVLDYQSLQQRLMPIVATAYVFAFARDALVRKYAEAKKTRQPAAVEEVHALSAGLKAQVTAYTAQALSTCREACGGHGYAAVNRLGALRSDHDIFQTFEGDNTVLLQQVAATLLKAYREQFRGAPVAASAQYLAQYLGGYVLPHNPLVTHEVSERHLRSPAFLRAALRHRTARLLFTLARRMRAQRARHGGSHFAAWNACLNHILALANAHIDSVCFDAASEAAERCGDRDCRRALRACAELYALRAVASDPLFRNDEYVAPAKAKAIGRLIVRLCAELRGVALPLVDAWAIPDFILRAPIGLSHAGGGSAGASAAAAAAAMGMTGSGVGATGGPGSGAGDMYREYLNAVGFGPDGDVADGSNVPGMGGPAAGAGGAHE